MGTLGPNSGQTFASDNTLGAVAIASPSNAALSDNSYATSVLLLSQISNYLKATNFGFTIPLDASISGILVEVERSSTALSAVIDNAVRIVKGGVIGNTDKSLAPTWPTSDAYASYGGSADLWGETWTPADINLSTFGVAISAIASLLAATAQIDHVRITVYYTGSNRPNAWPRLKAGNGMSVAG